MLSQAQFLGNENGVGTCFDPWPLPPTLDSWPLTGECSSEYFGTNPIFIAQKLSLWEHLPMKLPEMQILQESVENLRWERIALTRAIFKLWRWGWYQNAQKSIPQSGVSGRGSGVRGQGSKQGSNIKICFFLELFSRLHQLVTPILTPDPQPPTPDPWPLTGECSSEHFGTNPIFIAQKLSLWEHLPMKLLEMQVLQESVENLRWERIALTRTIFKLWWWSWYQNA